jgi:hypothetical protein
MTTTTKKKFEIDDLFFGVNAIGSILDSPGDHKNNKSELVVGVIIGRLLEIYSLQEVQLFLGKLNKTYDKSLRILYDPLTNKTTFFYSTHPLFNTRNIIRIFIKNIYKYFGLKYNPFDESYIINDYLQKDIKEFDNKNLGLYDMVCEVIDYDFFFKYDNLKVLYNIEGDSKAIPFDQSYKCVIDKIELLTQFVEKIDPDISYRILYRLSRDLGDYTLALRKALIENIKSKMDK